MGRTYKKRVCPICGSEFVIRDSKTPLKAYDKKLSKNKNAIYFCSIKCYEKHQETKAYINKI